MLASVQKWQEGIGVALTKKTCLQLNDKPASKRFLCDGAVQGRKSGMKGYTAAVA